MNTSNSLSPIVFVDFTADIREYSVQQYNANEFTPVALDDFSGAKLFAQSNNTVRGSFSYCTQEEGSPNPFAPTYITSNLYKASSFSLILSNQGAILRTGAEHPGIFTGKDIFFVGSTLAGEEMSPEPLLDINDDRTLRLMGPVIGLKNMGKNIYDSLAPPDNIKLSDFGSFEEGFNFFVLCYRELGFNPRTDTPQAGDLMVEYRYEITSLTVNQVNPAASA